MQKIELKKLKNNAPFQLDPIAFMLLQATGQAMNRFFTNQMEKQKFDVPNGEMDIKIVRVSFYLILE